MCKSTIRFSCARFMMLSLKGARQISGNNVTMSILTWKKTSNAECPTSNVQIVGRLTRSLPLTRSTDLPRRFRSRSLGCILWNAWASDKDASISFHNLEHRALAVTRCRTGQQGADSVDRLTRPSNHTAHVSASKLQLKSDCSAVRNFREHHVVRKFDQLANDELEKFSHW